MLGLATLFTGPAAAIAVAVPQPDSAALETRVWRANIDMQVACSEQYNGEYTAIKNGNGCDAWKCQVDGRERGLNIDLYCTRRFGGDAYASCGGGTAWDWQCHDRT